MTDFSTLDVSVSGHVAHVRFNRPDAFNTFVPALWRELPACADALGQDENVRAMVISSTGKHFTAGIDLSVLAGLRARDGVEPARQRAALMLLVKSLQATFSALAAVRIPVIAAVQGGCIGAGLDLVSACDLRYATREAFFSLHEINLALTADVGTFPRLQKLIPEGVAREMAYLGDRLPAERAERIGLVNGLYDDHAALLDGALAVAARIAEKSPLAVWGSKEMLNYGRDHSTADTLDHVATWQAGMLSEADIAAALGAQAQKRVAAFDGLEAPALPE